MTGLNFVGNNDTTLNDTIDAVNQNNPTIHSNFGHQFGKHDIMIYLTYMLCFNVYSPY